MKKNFTEEQLALYDKLVASVPGIERKGQNIPYTSVNGNMYSMLGASGLAIRLPEGVRNQFLEKYKTRLQKAFGMVMKEYAIVPDKLLKNTKELKKYFIISLKYAGTLKPKPTKRKK